ncbi:MAG TPA: excinuclease ABC subunit UvrA, partial [Acholeplasma sp.]|nr:excinuclease ABC subunit UvrA [Acholeplasma sp.]
MNDFISIKGARENNLKNINIDIPKNKFVVMTGVSGSGKSSLAFDTIYQEGQRRYMESLSSYARQFLGNYEKPDVDSIEGLSPSISIDQRTTSNNPRSTVGTVTEIYDFFRLLYARIGIPYCPGSDVPVTKQTIDEMTDRVMSFQEGDKIVIVAPVIERQKGTHKDKLQGFIKEGYSRVYVDGEIKLIEELDELDKNKFHTIGLVIDRVILRSDVRNRI